MIVSTKVHQNVPSNTCGRCAPDIFNVSENERTTFSYRTRAHNHETYSKVLPHQPHRPNQRRRERAKRKTMTVLECPVPQRSQMQQQMQRQEYELIISGIVGARIEVTHPGEEDTGATVNIRKVEESDIVEAVGIASKADVEGAEHRRTQDAREVVAEDLVEEAAGQADRPIVLVDPDRHRVVLEGVARDRVEDPDVVGGIQRCHPH